MQGCWRRRRAIHRIVAAELYYSFGARLFHKAEIVDSFAGFQREDEESEHRVEDWGLRNLSWK